jgi:hypothetical protein
VAAARAAAAQLGFPGEADAWYLGAAPAAAAGGEAAFVELAAAGRYAVVRLVRPAAGGPWTLAAAGPVGDQPVATGAVAPPDGLQAAADALTAAQRQGLALGLRQDAAWGPVSADADDASVTVTQAEGRFQVRLARSGGSWAVVDVEPRGGVARHSGAFAVSAPALDAAVAPPLRVTGTARVFEGVFFVELQDAAGRVLARQRVQVAAGADGWGAFDLRLDFTAAGPGRLVFGYASPKDGSRIEDVVVPVRLQGR